MLKRDFYIQREDGVNLFISHSDSNKMIRQIDTGVLYDAAIDVEDTPHTYEETEIEIIDEITDEEALNILLGGE